MVLPPRPPPGRPRAAPRSAEADRAILAATRAALAELGWGGLTLGDVAARAGVAKTTLYRRWAGKNELVVDAVAALFEEQLELPDRGSLEADIQGVVLRFAELLDRPETRTALMACVAEAAHDEALRRRIREADRGPAEAPGADRAGNAPSGAASCRRDDGPADPARDDLVFDVIAGAVVHRVMVSPSRSTRSGRCGSPGCSSAWPRCGDRPVSRGARPQRGPASGVGLHARHEVVELPRPDALDERLPLGRGGHGHHLRLLCLADVDHPVVTDGRFEGHEAPSSQGRLGPYEVTRRPAR